MVHVRTIITILILAISASLHGQDVPAGASPTDRSPVQTPVEEARALSGTLKDLLGQVHKQLGRIDEELKIATTEKQNSILADQQEDMTEARADLEKALNLVNGTRPQDMKTIRSEVDDVIRSVKEELEEIGSTSAVN